MGVGIGCGVWGVQTPNRCQHDTMYTIGNQLGWELTGLHVSMHLGSPRILQFSTARILQAFRTFAKRDPPMACLPGRCVAIFSGAVQEIETG